MTSLGDLNQRISIYEPTAHGDGSGGETVDWTHVLDAWASTKIVQANESETHGGLRSVQVCLFTVRREVVERLRLSGRAGLMTIDWAGARYNIREARPASPREPFADIKAETGVPL